MSIGFIFSEDITSPKLEKFSFVILIGFIIVVHYFGSPNNLILDIPPSGNILILT